MNLILIISNNIATKETTPTYYFTGTKTNIEQIDGNMTIPPIGNVLLKKFDTKNHDICQSSAFTKTCWPCPNRYQVKNLGCVENYLLGQINNITDYRNDLIGQADNFEKYILCDQPNSTPLA